MSRWIIKTGVQHVISWLPASYRWNELFQKHVTRGLQLRAVDFEAKLNCCAKHLSHYRQFSAAPRERFSVLELGTGWFPIVPIGLYLCGAAEVRSYDIVPLLRKYTLKQALDYFCRFDDEGKLRSFLPLLLPERMDKLREVAARAETESPVVLLTELSIYPVVQDARHTALPAGSIDLIFSTVALEHIPRSVIAGLFAEFRRLCSRSGVMSHYIGLADQYANFDHSITPFNFLKFSERTWGLLNNPMIPLTRLRIPEYRRLVQEAAFELVKEENVVGTVDDLNSVKLAPEFQNYSREDLLVLFSWLVSTPE